MEWWTGDPRFRSSLEKDPWGTVRKYRVEVDPLAVSLLRNIGGQDDRSLPADAHPGVKSYYRKMQRTRDGIAELRKLANSGNPAFAKWRSRQMARLAGQDHSLDSSRNPHLLFAVELSWGCSLQCDYCGVAAGPLRAVARFEAENEKLFREILHSFKEFFGDGSHLGLLYWATEPLDNPDYEKYLTAFYEEFGRTAETTTAAWYRDIGRTRRLLRQNKRQKAMGLRFSINSLSHLELCMETFSARELKKVELIMNHPESLTNISRTGRARQVPRAIDGTSACVTGFLINLPGKTVKLISPCIEPERWPLGYRIFKESSYKDGKHLLQFLRGCESAIMERTLDENHIPRLRRDFDVSEDKAGQITLTSKYRRFTVPEGLAADLVHAFDGKLRVRQILDKLSESYPPAAVRFAINAWWDEGFIEDFE